MWTCPESRKIEVGNVDDWHSVWLPQIKPEIGRVAFFTEDAYE